MRAPIAETLQHTAWASALERSWPVVAIVAALLVGCAITSWVLRRARHLVVVFLACTALSSIGIPVGWHLSRDAAASIQHDYRAHGVHVVSHGRTAAGAATMTDERTGRRTTCGYLRHGSRYTLEGCSPTTPRHR